MAKQKVEVEPKVILVGSLVTAENQDGFGEVVCIERHLSTGIDTYACVFDGREYPYKLEELTYAGEA